MNGNIQNQWKQENLKNGTKEMRIEELENWVIGLGENPEDVEFIQALIKTKENEIRKLNKNLNILGIDHVQTLELQVVQQQKDQILRKMVQMNDHMAIYKQ
jgi:hypothetical protein